MEKKFLKFISLMLTVAMLGTYGVYAEQSVDDTENLEEIEKEEFVIPEHLKFWITGETYKNDARFYHSERTSEGLMTAEKMAEVLQQSLPEINVERVLKDNYAFVNNSKKFWNLDQKGVMKLPALMNEKGKFSIPSETASQLFGIKTTGEYISAETIAENTEYDMFTDIRGFVLFSKNVSAAVKTNPISKNGITYYSDAFVISECIGAITWDDINPTKEDYAAYKKRWLEALTYPEGTQEKYQEYIDGLIKLAGETMADINRDSDIEPFYSIPIPDFTATQVNQAAVESCYTKVFNLAQGYRLAKMTGDTSLDLEQLKTDILNILELLYDKYYTNNCYRINGTPRFTTFRFQTPPTFANIIMLMYDELGEEKRTKYAYEMLGKQLHSPFISLEDGGYGYYDIANLMWSANGFFNIAIILEDTVRVNHCLRYLNNVFEFMKRGEKNPLPGDGWYEDGSFPYHGGVPYNLGYGHSFAITLADMALLTRDTIFDIRNIYGFERTYTLQTEAWIPFIHNNTRLKLIQGRESPDLTARYFLVAMMILADGAPESEKYEVTYNLKPKVENYYDVLFKKARLPIFKHAMTPYILESLADYRGYIENIETKSEGNYNKVYYNIDRVMHKTDNFIIGLSMSSERIRKYEALATNAASLQQWYIGDGMVYILAGEDQYSGKWWTNADPYYMPGTTVDSTERELIPTNDMPMPENTWSGGVTNGKVGVAGMILGNAAVSGLQGTKSYFMLDDEVVFVGSGIGGGFGNRYTVVDNYMLADEKIYVDGNEVSLETNKETTYENPKYCFVENGNGYVFIGDNNVTLNKKEYIEDKPYLITTTNHNEGQNRGYTYVILPVTNSEKVKAYSENPDVEIIANDSTMHAIKDKTTGIIMANIFQPSELEGFVFETPCCAIIEPKGTGKTLYVSDPTFKKEKITVTLPEGEKLENNEFCTADGNKVTVDITATIGRTYSFAVSGQGSGETAQSAVKTYNYNLICSGKTVTTKLYTASGNSGFNSYRVATAPKYGLANITGDTLIYTSLSPVVTEDEFEIEVSDGTGNSAKFSVKVKGK